MHFKLLSILNYILSLYPTDYCMFLKLAFTVQFYTFRSRVIERILFQIIFVACELFAMDKPANTMWKWSSVAKQQKTTVTAWQHFFIHCNCTKYWKCDITKSTNWHWRYRKQWSVSFWIQQASNIILKVLLISVRFKSTKIKL